MCGWLIDGATEGKSGPEA